MESTGPGPTERRVDTPPNQQVNFLEQVLTLVFNEIPETGLFSAGQIARLRVLGEANRLHRPEPLIEILEDQ